MGICLHSHLPSLFPSSDASIALVQLQKLLLGKRNNSKVFHMTQSENRGASNISTQLSAATTDETKLSLVTTILNHKGFSHLATVLAIFVYILGFIRNSHPDFRLAVLQKAEHMSNTWRDSALTSAHRAKGGELLQWSTPFFQELWEQSRFLPEQFYSKGIHADSLFNLIRAASPHCALHSAGCSGEARMGKGGRKGSHPPADTELQLLPCPNKAFFDCTWLSSATASREPALRLHMQGPLTMTLCVGRGWLLRIWQRLGELLK